MARHLITCAVAVGVAAVTVTGFAMQAAAAESGALRVLFQGYVNRQGHSAVATLGAQGIADVRDVPVANGGELSPDGRRLAFDTCRGAERAIAIAALDGSGVRLVAPVDGEMCVIVRWSRDGHHLSYAGGHDLMLHVIDLDTGANMQLQNTFLTASFHSWSPGSDAVAYSPGRGGSRRIDIIDLSTWQTRTLVSPEQFGTCEVWGPDWSPVDHRIAFTTCDGRLFTVNADGTGLTQMVGVTSAYAPRWSPDGQTLFFLTNGRLMRVTEGGGPHLVARLPFRGGPFSLAPLN